MAALCERAVEFLHPCDRGRKVHPVVYDLRQDVGREFFAVAGHQIGTIAVLSAVSFCEIAKSVPMWVAR